MGVLELMAAEQRLAQTGVQSVKALRRAGVERWLWQQLRPSPERCILLARGVWVSPLRLQGATHLVAHLISQLAPRGVVGLRSAAALHGLLEPPDGLDLLMPRGSWRTHVPWPISVRRFDSCFLPAGPQLSTARLEPGLLLWATSPARTVVDLLRFRRKVGEAITLLALRRFLDAGGLAENLCVLSRSLRATTALHRLLPLAALLPAPPPVTDCRPLVFPPGFSEAAASPFPPAAVR